MTLQFKILHHAKTEEVDKEQLRSYCKKHCPLFYWGTYVHPLDSIENLMEVVEPLRRKRFITVSKMLRRFFTKNVRDIIAYYASFNLCLRCKRHEYIKPEETSLFYYIPEDHKTNIKFPIRLELKYE